MAPSRIGTAVRTRRFRRTSDSVGGWWLVVGGRRPERLRLPNYHQPPTTNHQPPNGSSTRTYSVFSDRRSSPAAPVARRQPHRLLDDRQRGGVGHFTADAASAVGSTARSGAFPDVANWAWHEYGNRVGFWRFVELYERLGIRPTLSINGRVCIDYPRIVEAVTKAGWEMMGHSYEQMPMHAEIDPESMIVRTLDTLEKHTGQRPIGWLESRIRRDIRYAGPSRGCRPEIHRRMAVRRRADPHFHQTRPAVTLPYPIECQDVTTLAVQTQEAQYFTRKCIDAFERLYEESAGGRSSFPLRFIRTRPGSPRDQASRGHLRAHCEVQGRADLERTRDLRLVSRHPEKFVGPK